MNPSRSIVIAANPKSGSSSGLDTAHALRAHLEMVGFAPELFTDVTHMARRAKELSEMGDLRTVVSAGGDGTASLVLSLIPAHIPVTLFPLGSENLLAKYLEIPRDYNAVTRMIELGRTKTIDLFRSNDQLMLLMASVGFDAEVVRGVHVQRTSHVSRWRYRWAILSALFQYRWPALQISTRDHHGEWVDQGVGHWMFAFNVPKYAAGISIIENAVCDDGLIDVGLFKGGGLLQGLRHYWLVARGAHRSSPSWNQWRTTGVRVTPVGEGESDGKDLASYQLDGDWGGPIPLEIIHAGRSAILCVP
jgi:diacylglycerol kinase family enzyme